MRSLTAKVTGVLAVMLSCIGCSVFKEYERPEGVVPANLYGELPGGAVTVVSDSTGIEAIGWRDFFTDLALQALIELGLRNNADLQIAALRVVESEATLQSARLSFYPSFSISPSFQMQNSKNLGGSAVGFSIAPAASWELDLRGSLTNKKRYAEAALEQSKLLERSVRTELVSSIAQMYYTLVMLDAQKEISSSTFRNWQENVRIMRAMKDAGMANEASVTQTEANCSSIEASLYDLDKRIMTAENSLALLLGVPPGHFERGEFRGLELSGKFAAGVESVLLARRPDVMAAEQSLRMAYYDTNVARSAFYPSFRLSGEYGWEKALTSPAAWVLGLAANAAAPIFDAGRNRNNLKIAEARQQEALIAFRQSLLQAGNEVNSAIASCNLAESKKDIRIRQIESLNRAVESTRQLMSHSESTYLEVLTAQQSLLSARLQQVADHFEMVQGVISLYRALGGGGDY
ncbi:MAG: efflux transporter outer membrane subunit [Bacteroidales bacterium]|nr:efflux transporter outer membrane subunit [Bacteroidales bacterium]